MGNSAAARTAHVLLAHRAAGAIGRRRAMPKQAHPIRIEVDYGVALRKLLQPARGPIAGLVHHLRSALAEAAAERAADAAGEVREDTARRARELAKTAKNAIAKAVSPREIEALARRVADRTAANNREQLARQTRAALGADIFASDKRLPAIVDGFVAENVSLIESIPTRFAGDVEQLVTRAVTSGTRVEDLADQIDERWDVGERHASLIARDQVGKLYGQVNGYRQQDLGISKFTWTTMHDDRVRDEHDALDGQDFTWDEGAPEEGLPGEPIQCFPGDTMVSSHAAVEVVYRRRHRGECAVLKTDEGRVLSATLNHPILTSRGWLAAQDVEIGDHVVEASAQGVELLVDDCEHRDPTIEELFDALAPLGVRELRDPTTHGFHGDATLDEQVDVVDVHRGLGVELDPAITQAFCEKFLARADAPASNFRPFDLLFDRYAAPADRSVRGCCQLLALLLGSSGHSDEHRLRAIALLDAVAVQLGDDGHSLDAEVFRDLLHAPPVGVELRHHVARVVLGVGRRAVDGAPRLHTPSAEELAEVVRVHVEDPRGLGECVGGHQLLRVIEKTRREFVGHVYNLQTSSSWYVARNLIVHNCRCVGQPVVDDILDELEALESDDESD